MSHKLATPQGTAAFATRMREQRVRPGHYRQLLELEVSSLGLGSYLGAPDAATDELYTAAVKRCVELGCNLIDTAINYRFQRSERAIGAALAELFAAGSVGREQLVVASKAGFVPGDGERPEDFGRWFEQRYVDTGLVAADQLAAGVHCMAPRYLREQLENSLRNLRLEALDIYYLHNPETQLPELGRELFLERVGAAFAELERAVAEGLIGHYGTATWDGYRVGPEDPRHLELSELVELARQVAGEGHHFRVVQLPYNLAMTQAYTGRSQRVDGAESSLLAAAEQLGVAVIASAPLLQAKLARGLAPDLQQLFPELGSDAQRALQFVRATPGVVAALVGMKSELHVEENLALRTVDPPGAEPVELLLGKA